MFILMLLSSGINIEGFIIIISFVILIFGIMIFRQITEPPPIPPAMTLLITGKFKYPHSYALFYDIMVFCAPVSKIKFFELSSSSVKSIINHSVLKNGNCKKIQMWLRVS